MSAPRKSAREAQGERARGARGGRSLLALLRDVAGAATTETVIMIPVFIIIWGGIYYSYVRYQQAIAQATNTRHHAWVHALSSCEETVGSNTEISEASYEVDGIAGAFASASDFASDLISLAPGIEGLREISAVREGTVDKPAVLGEGQARLRYDLHLMCNTKRGEDFSLLTLPFSF